MNTDSKRLLWLDFETNGLFNKDYEMRVFEVGAVVTEADLTPLEEYHTLVDTPDLESLLPAMDDFVVAMHKKSGLFDALRSERGQSLQDVDLDLARLITKNFPHKNGVIDDDYEYKGAVIAGSSVGSFDLRIMAEFFPIAYRLCSYRTYDISAINEFEVRLGKKTVNTKKSSDNSKHRALTDIYVSIEKAQLLIDNR